MEHTLPTPHRPVLPYEIGNAARLIGHDWMLVCAGDNAMTASWGCLGVLWNKPVALCFVRPQRHTYTLAEQTDRIALAFFDETHRDALRYFGSHSGRDGDKFAATGLTRAHHPTHGTVYPAEARLVLFCRKIYIDDIKKANFIDPALLSNYPADDFHRVYVCEVEEAWEE